MYIQHFLGSTRRYHFDKKSKVLAHEVNIGPSFTHIVYIYIYGPLRQGILSFRLIGRESCPCEAVSEWKVRGVTSIFFLLGFWLFVSSLWCLYNFWRVLVSCQWLSNEFQRILKVLSSGEVERSVSECPWGCSEFLKVQTFIGGPLRH